MLLSSVGQEELARVSTFLADFSDSYLFLIQRYSTAAEDFAYRTSYGLLLLWYFCILFEVWKPKFLCKCMDISIDNSFQFSFCVLQKKVSLHGATQRQVKDERNFIFPFKEQLYFFPPDLTLKNIVVGITQYSQINNIIALSKTT